MRLSEADIERTRAEWDRHKGNTTHMARDLGLSRNAVQNRVRQMRASGVDLADYPTPKGGWGARAEAPGVEFPELPSELRPVEALVEERKAKFRQKLQAHEARRLITIQVKLDGPIGIAHLGDPHVDDDGTDIIALERHAKIIRDTEGLFGANVGDTSNNWLGRLARLWAEQSTSAAEAWQLAEWFVGLVPWLYMVGGNHDLWSGSGDPLKWIAAQHHALYEPSGIRIGLKFPCGREVRVNARHDFAGQSMWNPAHGAMKAAQMGWRDHILTCGHKHKSGYGVVKCPATGLVSHAIQVASYKVMDRYASEKGLPDQNISPAAVTVIDPAARDESALVSVFWDVETGAEFLKYLRGRK